MMIVEFRVHPLPHVDHTVSVNIHSCFLHDLPFGANEERLFALNSTTRRGIQNIFPYSGISCLTISSFPASTAMAAALIR